jgi:hypothetical protein
MTDADEVRITRADAAGLMSKLRPILDELTEQERAVLGLILARATSFEADVGGFAYEAYLNVKGTKQGKFKGQGVINGGVTQAAGFGPGIEVITVRKAGGTQFES